MKNRVAILSILFKTNNVSYTLITLESKTVFWTTSGCRKSRGLKKSSTTSVVSAAKSTIDYSLKLGFKHIYLKVKGFNKNKKLVVKYINQSLLNVILISDETSFPHNGCKKPKIRRI